MRKIGSSLVMIVLVLIMFWAATGWYFGERNELEFRQFIDRRLQSQSKKIFHIEITNYKKTWMGAKADILLSSDHPIVSERIDNIKIQAKLLNGPLFLSKEGIKTGTGLWQFKFNTIGLDKQSIENINSLFNEPLPHATVRINFNKKAGYSINIKSDWAMMNITGHYDLLTEDNRGAITFSNFTYDILSHQLKADEVRLSYQHQSETSSVYKPGTAAIQIPKLELLNKSTGGKIDILVKGSNKLSFVNNKLDGFFQVSIKADNSNNTAASIPFDDALFELNLKGLSCDGLISFSETKAELDNLLQQSQWVLEEQGEFPEGQDEIWRLHDSIQKISKALPQTLIRQTFNNGLAKIQFTLKTMNDSGDSTLTGNISPVPSATENHESLLSYFQMKAKAVLDKKMLAFLARQSAINKQSFYLEFKDNKLLMQ